MINDDDEGSRQIHYLRMKLFDAKTEYQKKKILEQLHLLEENDNLTAQTLLQE